MNRQPSTACPSAPASALLTALALAAFLWAAVSPLTAAPATITLERENEVISLGSRLEILEDESGLLKFQDILKGRQVFRKSEHVVPNYGFTKSAFWVRFRLQNRTDVRDWILQIDYPMLDNIELYQPDARGTWTMKRMGDMLPFGHRELKHRTFLAKLRPPADGATYYIRFQSEGTLQFPLYILTTETLRTRDHEEQFVLGIYYGIILVLALYNLVLFFIVRDTSYLYYLLYVTGYGAAQLILNGLAFEYFWPDWPWWANRSFPLLSGWTFFWALHFARTFLDTGANAPKLHRVMIGLMFGMILLMILSLTSTYYISISLTAFLVFSFSIVVLLTAMSCWKKGYRPSRYFLIAWASLLFGLLIYSLKGYGVLPRTFLTEYGLQIGSAIEMSLLSMGLADRINVMTVEKEEAKRNALEIKRLHQEAQLHSARLEIELLKKNIQPHFLLNSINATIIWLEDDPASAARLLNSLADELRLLLNYSSRQLISMEEELQLCRAHLEVMSLRHDKEFTLEIENINMQDTIPPLVIHTLIENGLTHGYAQKERGVFRLTGEILTDGSCYVLTNDGSSEVNESRSATGIGLKYVRTRLEEAFPGRWHLVSGPFPGGWMVTLVLARLKA